jgi:hypothetical protein
MVEFGTVHLYSLSGYSFKKKERKKTTGKLRASCGTTFYFGFLSYKICFMFFGKCLLFF